MNAPRILLTAALCALSACYAADRAEDEPFLRGLGVGSPEPDASNPPSGASDAAMADMSPGLQVWLGSASTAGGGLLVCGPYTPEPEKRALLLLELGADGELRGGSLTLGEGPPLPNVVDPNAYYPPEPPWACPCCPMTSQVPGFEYALYDARLVQGRLTASIHSADVFKEWCELQPSYPASPLAAEVWGEYLCRPTDHVLTSDDLYYLTHGPGGTALPKFVPEDLCFKENAPCLCDADSCTATPYLAQHLDLQLTGDVYSGRFERWEIRFERRE